MIPVSTLPDLMRRVHELSNLEKCDICNKKFKTKQNVRLHKERVHVEWGGLAG